MAEDDFWEEEAEKWDEVAEGPVDDPSLAPRTLREAMAIGDLPEIRRRLSQMDIFQLNERTKQGFTYLMYAMETGNPAVVQLILDSGVDPETTDFEGYQAIDYLDLNSPDALEIQRLWEQALEESDQLSSQPPPKTSSRLPTCAEGRCGNKRDPVTKTPLRPGHILSIYWSTNNYLDYFRDESVERGRQSLSLDPRTHCYDVDTLKEVLRKAPVISTSIGPVVQFPPGFYVREIDALELRHSSDHCYTARPFRMNIVINHVLQTVFQFD